MATEVNDSDDAFINKERDETKVCTSSKINQFLVFLPDLPFPVPLPFPFPPTPRASGATRSRFLFFTLAVLKKLVAAFLFVFIRGAFSGEASVERSSSPTTRAEIKEIVELVWVPH